MITNETRPRGMRARCGWLLLAALGALGGLAPGCTPEETATTSTGGTGTGGSDTGGNGTGASDTGGSPAGGNGTGGNGTGGVGTGGNGTGGVGTGGNGTGGSGGGWAPVDSARVFLSGHSLTDDPLADFVLEIAASRGKDFNYNQQIGLGSPIRVRTKGGSFDDPGWPGYSTGKNRDGSNMNVIEELKSPATLGPGELYDTLLITERHDILDTIPWEDTFGFLRHYHDRLIDGNAAGQTLFYHSWLDIDKNDPTLWIQHEKNALHAWECVASKVNLSLAAEGRTDRAWTLPAGAALVDLVERVLADEVPGITGSTPQKLNALFNDNVHLTPLGVYYIALVTYAAVFHDSPVGAAVPNGVASQPAPALQQIAWDFVSAYHASPSPGEHTMEECRSFISQNLCSSFWTILDTPQKIGPCQTNYANPDWSQNPFRWPDPQLSLWPDP